MKIENWSPDKEYSELDCVTMLGRAYALVDRNRQPNDSHIEIKTKKIPLRRTIYRNLVKERSNRDFVEKALEYFPDNEEDQLEYWRKL